METFGSISVVCRNLQLGGYWLVHRLPRVGRNPVGNEGAISAWTDPEGKLSAGISAVSFVLGTSLD